MDENSEGEERGLSDCRVFIFIPLHMLDVPTPIRSHCPIWTSLASPRILFIHISAKKKKILCYIFIFNYLTKILNLLPFLKLNFRGI